MSKMRISAFGVESHSLPLPHQRTVASMIHWPLRCLWIVAAVAILAECAQSPAQQQSSNQQPTEQSSTSEHPSVVQPPNGQQPARRSVGSPQGQQTGPSEPCYLIKDGLDFKKWKDCQFDDENPHLGHLGNFIVLDFTPATEGDIKTLLDRFPSNTKLYAGIKLVNSKIETLDLGKITKLIGIAAVPENALFIEISHNMKLQSIKWDLEDFITYHKIQILIYNNPNLTLDPKLKDQLLTQATPNSYIQENSTECMFARPTAEALYRPPNDELLKKCESVKGDLQLEKRTLSNDLTIIEAGCLRLVDVNMESNKINIGNLKSAKVKCDNNQTSEITNNKGLCRDKLETLMQYFPAGNTVPVKLHDSCGILCKDQSDIGRQYEFCSGINKKVDITTWFTDPKLAGKAENLITATGELTISGPEVRTISLPRLKQAAVLKITGNRYLDRIELPEMTQIDSLVIEDNKLLNDIVAPNLRTIGEMKIQGSWLLTLDKIQRLPIPKNLNASEVECVVVTSQHNISDFEQLRHCTSIKGFQYLRLENIKQMSDGLFRVKTLDGCLKIENSALWDLDFLNRTRIIGCERNQHIFKHNRHLCYNWLFDGNSPNQKYRNIGPDVFGCAKRCWNLTEGQCTTFYGDVFITDKFNPEHFQLLEVIRGRLIINATGLEQLKFPRLRYISGDNLPLLIVQNNSKLHSLKIIRMRGFVNGIPATKDRPLIHLENNPWLHKLVDFLPMEILRNCSRKRTDSACFYDEKKTYYQLPARGLNGLDIIGIVCTTTVFATIIIACCRFKFGDWQLEDDVDDSDSDSDDDDDDGEDNGDSGGEEEDDEEEEEEEQEEEDEESKAEETTGETTEEPTEDRTEERTEESTGQTTGETTDEVTEEVESTVDSADDQLIFTENDGESEDE